MKTQLLRLALFACLLAACLGARTAFAVTTSTLLSEDFSGSSTPNGWFDGSYGYWFHSGNGNGGSNGSMMFDFYDFGYGALYTPNIDASGVSASTDTCFLEFDFWAEYDYWDVYGGDDLYVYANGGGSSAQLLHLNVQSDYTYNYSSDYGALYDPNTSSSEWRHYKVGIPAINRASDMQIEFQGSANAGGGNAAIDNVVVTGIHYQVLNFSSSITNFDFGKRSIGDTSAAQSFTIFNPNPITIHLTNLQQTGSSDFIIVHAPSNLPPGSNARPTHDSVVFRYSPSTGGPAFGGFSFSTDADVPKSVTLGFKGVGLAPVISINNTQNLFIRRNTKLGDTITQGFLITNTGAGKLEILPATTIGGDNPAEYSIIRSPGETILGGQSDSMILSYHPTLEGSHPATLTVVSNGGADQQVSLRGVGTLPRLALESAPGTSVSQINFDSVGVGTQVCQTISLHNVGSDTVAILSNNFTSSDYDFAYTGVTGTDTLLAPDQSRTVTVCFTPLKNGYREATLRVRTNIPLTFSRPQQDTSAFVLQISGTGVPFGRLSVGGLHSDSSILNLASCQTDTLRNYGSSTLTITNASLTGTNASEFSLSGISLPFALQPNQSKVVTFCFTPSQRGARSASLVLTGVTDGSTQTFTMPITDYGLAVCASPSTESLFDKAKTLVGRTDTGLVIITNCGDVPATFTAVAPTSPSPYAVYGVATSPVIQPGATTSFSMTFAPTTRTQTPDVLTVNGTTSQNTPVPTMSITLSGFGGGVTATASGNGGNVQVGDCRTFDVTITNSGNMDWTPGSPIIGGVYVNDFTIAGNLTPSTIPAGGTATLPIKFCPSTSEGESAILAFQNSTPQESPAFSYTLTGNGGQSRVADAIAKNGFVLEPSYPNPFNTTAKISFTLPTDALVHLDVVDQTGSVVTTLANGRFTTGEHAVTLSSKNMASGTYFYILTSGDVRLVRELNLVK